MPKLTFISDTHNLHSKIKIEPCDILIHTGDATGRGTIPEISSFLYWLSNQPAQHKVFVSGNHDWIYQKDPQMASMLISQYSDITYLQDSMVELMGLKIYGSPWTPRFYDWAFMGDPPLLETKWSQIPDGIDILLTHGPAYGILDDTDDNDKAGCKTLRHHILTRIKPKVFCSGHIHEGYGQLKVDDTLFINASSCNSSYRPVNPPITIEV